MFFCYNIVMSWKIDGYMPSIETPETCSAEVALLATRPEIHTVNVAAVISCSNILEGRPIPFFETSTECFNDNEALSFTRQVRPIAEMATRQMCANCPKVELAQEPSIPALPQTQEV